MRRIRPITTILMMLGLCAGLAHGQKGTPGVKVIVPFPFVIQRTTFSSGDYSFFSSRDKVWIQEANGRNVAVLLTGAQDGRVTEKDSRVIFDCYLGECFLSQVWIAGQEGGRTLPKSRRQIELAKTYMGQQFSLSGKTP